MKTYDIKVRFFGKAFQNKANFDKAFQNETDNVDAMNSLSECVSFVTQQTIAIHLGRNELADALKDQINQTISINEGVLEIEISFERNFYTKFGITGFDESGISFSDNIARLFYCAISLRRHVAEAKKNGESIQILLNTNPEKDCRSVVKSEGGKITLKHPKIFWAAQMTKEATDKILHLIDGDNVSGFEFDGLSRDYVSREEDFIVLDHDKSDLIAITNFTGRLDNLFLAKQSGTVISKNKVYQITWDDETQEKIMSHKNLDTVEFIAKPCIETHSRHGELVVYKILDCVAVNVKQNTEQEALL